MKIAIQGRQREYERSWKILHEEDEDSVPKTHLKVIYFPGACSCR